MEALTITSPKITGIQSQDEQDMISCFGDLAYQTPIKSMSKKRLLGEIESPISSVEQRLSPTNIQEITELPTYSFRNSPNLTKRQLLYVKPVRPTPSQLKKPPSNPVFKMLGNEMRRTSSFSITKTEYPIDSDTEADEVKCPSTPQPYSYLQDNEVQIPHLPHENDNCVNYVSPEVVAKVIDGEYLDKYHKIMIVDSRFSFEYESGHIKDAYNISDPKTISSLFFSEELNESISTKTLVIFYCEFSIKRSFEMIRYLRELDRKHNRDNYPHLCYPEIYILKDGYRRFHELYKNLCYPNDYTPMNDACHRDERFSACKALSTSWKSLGKSFHI